MIRFAICAILSLATFAAAAPATRPSVVRTQDVVYGRYHGTALTFDVLAPSEGANGAAVMFICSGGWISSHEAINPLSIAMFIRPFIDRGYTVFAVVHPSQPRFTIREIAPQIDRAVRFVRANAKRFNIDPDRIGIYGGSAGGHLSLLQATNPAPGRTFALDPIERASGEVQAVGVFFPLSDMLNFGAPGHIITKGAPIGPFRAAFDFQEFNREKNLYERVSEEEQLNILRELSPINYVTSHSPPTLIIHGDQDKLVPMQQSEIFVAKMKESGATCELIVKQGAGHGWLNVESDMNRIADFFDEKLPKHPEPATESAVGK